MILFPKLFITSVLLAALGSCLAQGQTRFFDPSFAVGVSYDIPYGKSYGLVKKSKPLHLDIYQPLDDTLKKRPLIIFAHGGGYVIGNKNNFPMETLCSRFAQMGYVCASIEYSLGFLKKGNPDELAQKTVLMAMQDMKAAIRFFRAMADSGNPYQIDPDMIWVGGSSAGAITALHVAFLREVDTKHLKWDVNDFGGLEGNGGHAGYSTQVNGVIALSGAIGDTLSLNENIPVVSVHGTNDPIVPYGVGRVKFKVPLFAKVPEARVMGPEVSHPYLTQRGTPNSLLPIPHQGHCPFDRVLDWKHYPVYMDMTINHVRNFMYNELWNKGEAKTDMNTQHATTLAMEREGNSFHFYPVDKGIKVIKLYFFDENGNRFKKKKIRKKKKGFSWKAKKMPAKYEMRAVYNLFRTDWWVEN
jgi:acetyl esterase/lipase